MGEELIRLIQNKVSRQQKLAFLMTLVFALLVHMYKFTNTLLNHDSLHYLYADQNVIGSGRWALKLACLFTSQYDLPWFSGVMCCVMIALTAAVIVSLLRIRNGVLIFLCGGLLAASPATTETLFFQFTADGYFVAMLLAAVAVWLSRIEEKRASRNLLSGVCICLCCGIYQAYVSFALVLSVCYFIQELFLDRHSRQDCFAWIGRQILIYSLSLAAYYGIWQWSMTVTGIPANNYLGISQVGTISKDLLCFGARNACRSVADYFLQLATIRHEWPLYTKLNLLVLAALGVMLIVASIRSGCRKRLWALALVGLSVVAIVPFSAIWCFVSYSITYRPLMMQSLTLVFLLVGVLCEQWARPLMKNAVALLLLVVVLHNALLANISYLYMERCYERTYAEALTLSLDIREIQEKTPFTDVAVLGSRYWDSIWKLKDPLTGELTRESNFYLLSGLLEETLLLDYMPVREFLNWYLGMDIQLTSVEKTNQLKEMAVVQQMPVWPAAGSLKVIDGTLVIVLTEQAAW